MRSEPASAGTVTLGVARAGRTFDFDAFMSAVQTRRRELGLSWMEFATVLWDQSDELNRHRDDHPL